MYCVMFWLLFLEFDCLLLVCCLFYLVRCIWFVVPKFAWFVWFDYLLEIFDSLCFWCGWITGCFVDCFVCLLFCCFCYIGLLWVASFALITCLRCLFSLITALLRLLLCYWYFGFIGISFGCTVFVGFCFIWWFDLLWFVIEDCLLLLCIAFDVNF